MAYCLLITIGIAWSVMKTKASNDLTIEIESIPIADIREQQLLGITLDKKLAFTTHIESLYKKVNKNSMVPLFWYHNWKIKSYRRQKDDIFLQ